MMKKPIVCINNEGQEFCWRCKEDLTDMMTRVWKGIKWCHLCSFDLEEASAGEKESMVRGAKEFAKEMNPQEEGND